jgi:phenylacetate-coenzyme A ligase PaaK-like adenylate-forming protein
MAPGFTGPLQDRAYSTKPFSFLDQNAQNDLATFIEIDLIENGSRAARERWQKAQLVNLIQFAHANSEFWRSRLPLAISSEDPLSGLGSLSRLDVNYQVEKEGALCSQDLLANVVSYASSGSTGTPVKTFSMQQNAHYNELRSLAQYYVEGRNLKFNRTFIKPADGRFYLDNPTGSKVEIKPSWIGNFTDIYHHGHNKIIQYDNNADQLVDELLKHEVGYLACLGSHMDILLRVGGEELIKKLKIEMWLHHSDNFDPNHRLILDRCAVPIRSSYSCAELGPIAIECPKIPGFYHVVHSNVIVEGDEKDAIELGEIRLHKILLTHLHSYATPLIRYDVGDYACFHHECPCGHDGNTLSNIFGRKKYFLNAGNGEMIPFPIFSKPLLDLLYFDEFFIYQPDLANIIVVFGGPSEISSQQRISVINFIKSLSHARFNISIKVVPKIDWSKNPKHLPFLSYVS